MSGVVAGIVVDTGVRAESIGGRRLESLAHVRMTNNLQKSADGFLMQIGPINSNFGWSGGSSTFVNGYGFIGPVFAGYGNLSTPTADTPSIGSIAVIGPTAPSNTEVDGTTFYFSAAAGNATTGTLLSNASIGYNPAYTFVSGSPAGTYYGNGNFGIQNSSTVLTISCPYVYFKPGTWQAQVTSYYTNTASYIPFSGNIVVAGNTITSYSAGSGFSALSGGTSGTFDFVVTGKGGFATMSATDFTDGSTVSIKFTFLHS